MAVTGKRGPAWGSGYHGCHLRPHGQSWPSSLADPMVNLCPIALATPIVLPSLVVCLPGCGHNGNLWEHVGPAYLMPHGAGLMQHFPASPSHMLWARCWCAVRSPCVGGGTPWVNMVCPSGPQSKSEPWCRGAQGQRTGRDRLEENKSINIASQLITPGWLIKNVNGTGAVWSEDLQILCPV
jgi:hypothetical protein